MNSDYLNTEIINNGINNIINKELNNHIYKKKNIIFKKIIINKNNLSHYSHLKSIIPFQRKRNYSSFQVNNFPNYNNNIIYSNKNYETEKINNIIFEEEEKENILNKDDLKYIGFSQEKNYINEKNEKLNILHVHLESVDYIQGIIMTFFFFSKQIVQIGSQSLFLIVKLFIHPKILLKTLSFNFIFDLYCLQ